jgi:hypothetical protein
MGPLLVGRSAQLPTATIMAFPAPTFEGAHVTWVHSVSLPQSAMSASYHKVEGNPLTGHSIFGRQSVRGKRFISQRPVFRLLDRVSSPHRFLARKRRTRAVLRLPPYTKNISQETFWYRGISHNPTRISISPVYAKFMNERRVIMVQNVHGAGNAKPSEGA